MEIAGRSDSLARAVQVSDSPDGNPDKIPRMVPTRDWAPPFSYAPLHGGNVISHARAGTGEPQQRLRIDASFHRIWGPFWKGTGCFGGPVGVRDRPETPRLAAVSRSCQGFTGTGKTRGLEFGLGGEISNHVEDAGRGFVARRAAAAVASLKRWRGMLSRAKRRRSSGSVSKSASMKISTVSSLA